MILHGYHIGRLVPRGGAVRKALSTRLQAAGLLAAGVLGAAGSGWATTLDFSGLSTNTNSYTHDGFSLTTTHAFHTTFWGNPTPGMFLGATIQLNTLRLETGGAFDLFSMDLTEMNEMLGAQTIEFTGWLADGNTVTQVFTTDGPFGYQTFTFSDLFRSLAKVQWDQMNPESAFIYDNIVVAATPVAIRPASWSGIRALYGR